MASTHQHPLVFAKRSAIRVARRVFGCYVKSHKQFRVRVAGKAGLEIGGPSNVFRDEGPLPLYRSLRSLGECVYPVATVWEGTRAEGLTFSYCPPKENGFNLIREATDLHGIADHRYDFVLSSHSMEHTANPVKALKEWSRVVKPGGAIIILRPDYRLTFDRRRTPTPVAHMLEDFRLGTDVSDLTHLSKTLELHDLSRDPAAGSPEAFRRRSLQNFENRCLHHHVFDEQNSEQLLQAAGLAVDRLELAKPFHIAILARCAFSPTASASVTGESGLH